MTLCCCFTLNQMQLVDRLSPHSLFHLTCCLNLSCLQWHYCYLCRVCISYPAYVQRTRKHSPQREAGQEISLVDWSRTPCQSMLVSGRPGQTHEHAYSYTIVLINISAASSIIHTHIIHYTYTSVPAQPDWHYQTERSVASYNNLHTIVTSKSVIILTTLYL